MKKKENFSNLSPTQVFVFLFSSFVGIQPTQKNVSQFFFFAFNVFFLFVTTFFALPMLCWLFDTLRNTE
jgi:hypothetical protein